MSYGICAERRSRPLEIDQVSAKARCLHKRISVDPSAGTERQCVVCLGQRGEGFWSTGKEICNKSTDVAV